MDRSDPTHESATIPIQVDGHAGPHAAIFTFHNQRRFWGWMEPVYAIVELEILEPARSGAR